VYTVAPAPIPIAIVTISAMLQLLEPRPSPDVPHRLARRAHVAESPPRRERRIARRRPLRFGERLGLEVQVIPQFPLDLGVGR
jgi:hypothetical protein